MEAKPRRVVVLALAGLATAAVASGVAFARSSSPSIGTGVVVVETNLAYQNSAAAGTGIVLAGNGRVLTNNHVIRGATTIKIRVPGTQHTYAAQVLGYDVADDVAVLQASGASHLKTAALDTSTAPAVGQVVTALGNAGGTGTLTSARGRITGIGKSIEVGDDQGGVERLKGLIETNAALQPGDSGGPLLSRSGKVIGMDTAASAGNGFYAAASNDGYAIPIAKATRIAKQIASGTSSATVHIGATAFLGVEIDTSDGYAAIAAVVPGGPADSAGLAEGDVITAVGGRAVSSPAAVANLLFTRKPGDRITVAFEDGYGTTRTTTVTLGSGPPQ